MPGARGRVLEIGVGSGLNLPHYDAASVAEVVGIDPSAELLREAERVARRLPLPIRLHVGSAEDLPFDDASFDSVVITYTLCSVPSLDRALAEVRRVLRPDGAVYFCEHGRAPDAGVRRVQALLEPAWKRLAGGCHLTRDTPAALERAGFAIEELDTMYLPGARFMNWNAWGVARPARGAPTPP